MASLYIFSPVNNMGYFNNDKNDYRFYGILTELKREQHGKSR